MSHRTRIMYIEDKSDGLVGPARIGRVTYSKTGKSFTYRGRQFGSLNGTGIKANFGTTAARSIGFQGVKRMGWIRFMQT